MSERAPILLIDDQELVAQTLRGLLEGADDLELHYCGNPAQAIATAAACRPDVILLDLVMPGVDGLMLLRFFRGHPDFQRTPILLLSTRDEPESKARAFEQGANDYLIKLPHRTEMLARLRYHVAAFRLQRERDQAREELASANQELQRANQAKSRFIARMSHELRTPLNGILGLCQVLEESGLPALQTEYVGIIRGAGDLLLSVINDILDYSKIESGKVELESIPFSLEEAVEHVLRLLASRAHQKGLALVANLDPALPAVVLGDPLRLRQVLWNLVGNATKFTERGEIEVRLELVSAADDRAVVDLSVRDTGIGIPPEVQGQVFQAFSQADATTARRYGGTGLGLVIAQNLCHLMGGDLTLESQVGLGTTFSARVSFPIVEPAAPTSFPELCLLLHEPNPADRAALTRVLQAWGVRLAEGSEDCNAVLYHEGGEELPASVLAAQEALLPAVALVPLGITRGNLPGSFLHKPLRRAELKERLATLLEPPDDLWDDAPPVVALPRSNGHGPLLLVADDNPTNLLVARAMLEQMGYRVLEAHDGQNAVDLADHQELAGILLDCDMPVLDGFEAARRIRASRGPEMPILALTAYSGDEVREQCLAAGMNDYAGKPLDRAALGTLLERWVRLPGSPPPPAAGGSNPAAG